MPAIATRISPYDERIDLRDEALTPGHVSAGMPPHPVSSTAGYMRSPLGAEFLDDAHALSMYPDGPYFVRGFITATPFVRNTALQALAAAGVKV